MFKIVSGGQTGVDRAALDCALKLMSQEKQSDQSITLKPDDDGGESFNEKYKTLEDVLKKLNK